MVHGMVLASNASPLVQRFEVPAKAGGQQRMSVARKVCWLFSSKSFSRMGYVFVCDGRFLCKMLSRKRVIGHELVSYIKAGWGLFGPLTGLCRMIKLRKKLLTLRA